MKDATEAQAIVAYFSSLVELSGSSDLTRIFLLERHSVFHSILQRKHVHAVPLGLLLLLRLAIFFLMITPTKTQQHGAGYN